MKKIPQFLWKSWQFFDLRTLNWDNLPTSKASDSGAEAAVFLIQHTCYLGMAYFIQPINNVPPTRGNVLWFFTGIVELRAKWRSGYNILPWWDSRFEPCTVYKYGILTRMPIGSLGQSWGWGGGTQKECRTSKSWRILWCMFLSFDICAQIETYFSENFCVTEAIFDLTETDFRSF